MGCIGLYRKATSPAVTRKHRSSLNLIRLIAVRHVFILGIVFTDCCDKKCLLKSTRALLHVHGLGQSYNVISEENDKE